MKHGVSDAVRLPNFCPLSSFLIKIKKEPCKSININNWTFCYIWLIYMSCPFNNRNFFWFGFIYYLFYFSSKLWFVLLLLSNRSNSKCFFFGFFLKICLIYNFGDEVFVACLESPKNENYELYLESNSNRNYKTLPLFLYDSFLFYYYYITNPFL